MCVLARASKAGRHHAGRARRAPRSRRPAGPRGRRIDHVPLPACDLAFAEHLALHLLRHGPLGLLPSTHLMRGGNVRGADRSPAPGPVDLRAPARSTPPGAARSTGTDPPGPPVRTPTRPTVGEWRATFNGTRRTATGTVGLEPAMDFTATLRTRRRPAAALGLRRCAMALTRVRMAEPAASSGLSAIGRRPRRDRLLPMLPRAALKPPGAPGRGPPFARHAPRQPVSRRRVSQVCVVVLATPQVRQRLTHAERGCRWLHQRDRAPPPPGGSGSC